MVDKRTFTGELSSLGENESSFEYGSRLADELIKKRRKERRGGRINPSEKRTIRYFSQTYAFIQNTDRHYLSKEDLQDGIRWGVDPDESVTKHRLSTFPNRIASYFKGLGWSEVNTNFLPNNHELNKKELLHTSSEFPSLTEIGSADEIGGSVLSKTDIIEFIGKNTTVLRHTEKDDKNLIAAAAAIETQADNQDWLLAKGVESDTRIWISPESIFRRLNNYVNEEVKVASSNLSQVIADHIEENLHGTPSEQRVSFGEIISEFEKQLRSNNWSPITIENDKLWYSDPDLHKEKLIKHQQNHQEIIDNPGEYPAKEIRPTHSFLKRNGNELVQLKMWEYKDLQTKCNRLKFHAEADERFAELERGEPEYRYGKIGQ